MGKTSSAVKNKYNAKAYDQIGLRVKKGEKELLQKFAEENGESLNGLITKAIYEYINNK